MALVQLAVVLIVVGVLLGLASRHKPMAESINYPSLIAGSCCVIVLGLAILPFDSVQYWTAIPAESQ